MNTSQTTDDCVLEMCMGMGKTGIPWVSHSNGNAISPEDGNGNKMHGNGN